MLARAKIDAQSGSAAACTCLFNLPCAQAAGRCQALGFRSSREHGSEVHRKNEEVEAVPLVLQALQMDHPGCITAQLVGARVCHREAPAA